MAGFESSIGNPFGRGTDLGLFFEYSYDGRTLSLETPLQNDLVLGLRWQLNNGGSTALLAGAAIDLAQDSWFWRVEAQYRIGAHWTADLTLQGFPSVVPGEPRDAYRDDAMLRLQVKRWF